MGIPMVKVFNDVVAMDMVKLKREIFLVVVDLATHYFQGSWIRNKTPMEILKRVYGKMDWSIQEDLEFQKE